MKLRNKVFALNASIVLLVLLLGGIVSVELIYDYNLANIYQNLSNQSSFSQRYLEQYLKSSSAIETQLVIQQNKSLLEEQLIRQVGNSVKITGLIANENLRPEQDEALKGNKAYYAQTKGEEKIFFFSFPIIYNGDIVGTFTYEYPLYELDKMRRDLFLIFSGLFLIALPLVFVLSYSFSVRIIKPLEKLRNTTREYSRGIFKKELPVKTGDEIEELALSFSKMGQDINNIIQNLQLEKEKQKQFYDNVTHEIKTPLTNIIGYADLLTRVKDADQRGKCRAYIKMEGERLLHMLESLLELSSLKQYDLVVEKEYQNIRTIIEKALEVMHLRLEKYGFTLVTKLEQVYAPVDGEKIKQVLINLLDNALKYSDGDRIELRLWQGNLIFLSIADNGCGIPEADLEHIMDPFYRVEKSRSRNFGGAGLGLSICREIVGKHGGQLDIESKVDMGTIVTISLQPCENLDISPGYDRGSK